jgi:hypothetical protein
MTTGSVESSTEGLVITGIGMASSLGGAVAGCAAARATQRGHG